MSQSLTFQIGEGVSIVVPVSTRRQVTIKRLSLPFTVMSASDALAAVKTVRIPLVIIAQCLRSKRLKLKYIIT